MQVSMNYVDCIRLSLHLAYLIKSGNPIKYYTEKKVETNNLINV